MLAMTRHYLRLNIKWIKLRSDYSLLDLAQTHHNNNLGSQDCPDPSVKVAELFLWDPSPVIGYPCHSPTYLLTLCFFVNLIDMILANEYDSLVQIWKLKFGHKVKFFVQTLGWRLEGLKS